LYYYLECSYEDYDLDFEEKIEKLVGKERCGSGMGFGKRDIGFDFETREECMAAKKRLSRLKRYKFKSKCMKMESKRDYSMTLPLCKDCKYFTQILLTPPYCYHPDSRSLVDGNKETCLSMRENYKLCGTEGHWYVPNPRPKNS